MTERLLGIISAHGGLDRGAAERALVSTLRSFAGFLDEALAARLDADLPARFLAGAPAATSSGGREREEMAAVCRALAEVLPEDTLAALRAAAPAEVAGWLSPPAPEVHPPAHAATSSRGTLADGRPGSRHPISEADTDGAQSHSVIRSSDPHGDSTLSGGRPGSQHPLSETKK